MVLAFSHTIQALTVYYDLVEEFLDCLKNCIELMELFHTNQNHDSFVSKAIRRKSLSCTRAISSSLLEHYPEQFWHSVWLTQGGLQWLADNLHDREPTVQADALSIIGDLCMNSDSLLALKACVWFVRDNAGLTEFIELPFLDALVFLIYDTSLSVLVRDQAAQVRLVLPGYALTKPRSSHQLVSIPLMNR
jgi:hypothetical protein